MILGIDLHNIRDGGGPNYIRNLLTSFDPALDRFSHIHLFGAAGILEQLPDSRVLTKHAYRELEGSLLKRRWFVSRRLPGQLRAAGCDIVFTPGGLRVGTFRPYVTISRNMLPFQPEFWNIYPRFSANRLRLRLLRRANAASFARADGLIFLSETAKATILPLLSRVPERVTVVPHGVDHARFHGTPRTELPASGEAVRLIYPSRVEPYKNQVAVVNAFTIVRQSYPNATLTLCGQANPDYLEQVREAIATADPAGKRIAYIGVVPNAELPRLYRDNDLLLFASSCENLPNTLIEAMACGIPICCSDCSPMPEIAGECSLYFDPTSAESIADCIKRTLADRAGTLARSRRGIALASAYSWEKTARQTFAFIADAAGSH